jgi:iron complex outermembrane receptor protein
MYVSGNDSSTGTSSNFGQTLRDRKAQVMIDDIQKSCPLINGSLGMKTLAPNVIERIEIIQGATSIYGYDAAGCTIHCITKNLTIREKSKDQNIWSLNYFFIGYFVEIRQKQRP